LGERKGLVGEEGSWGGFMPGNVGKWGAQRPGGRG
jgi:hypothetical protein